MEQFGKILVVDDEPGVRDILKTYIEYEGFSVTTAPDGIEALHLAESETFDVVLSDILMPRMDGLTLAAEIRRVQPDTVVVLMTGYASVNTAVEAIKRNVFDYILKPFQNMQIVLQAVRRAIERKQLIQERKTLIEDLKETNAKLAHHRQLLMAKVTETDNELARRVERLSILYEISRSASSITGLDQLLVNIMKRVSAAMNNSPGILWLLDESKTILKRHVAVGLDHLNTVPESISRDEGEVGEAVRDNRVRVCRMPETMNESIFSELMKSENITSMVMIPFNFEETALGAFTIFFKEGTPSEDDISLLSAIADQTSVSIKNAELFADQQRLFRETIEALATAIDSRDHYTGGHSYMVTQYSLAIVREMGFNEKDTELIRVAGLLHDIGKIGISDNILNKPGKLTEEEMGVIKAHPILGRMIIESIEALKPAARIVYHHHEHYDGSGYPEGVKGKDIPLESRILQVADIFHALTSDRIYRKAMSLEQAIAVIREEMGSIIDPEIGEIFLGIIGREDFRMEHFLMPQMI
jgi:putative nucleotidyltransferase with HDIG domain